jgi:hypothetical protein
MPKKELTQKAHIRKIFDTKLTSGYLTSISMIIEHSLI